MKLLFDQNISFRIISKIKTNFPEAKQVRQLGIENYSDIEIWEFAKKNQYTIVTFDVDFFDLSNFKGHPPKNNLVSFWQYKNRFSSRNY